MKKNLLILLLFFVSSWLFAQSISEYNYNVNYGDLPGSYNSPGNIIYPNGYSRQNVKTPVVFVHGITGKVSNSYKANIDQVINYHLNAAFVQLNPLGTPEQNGKLLKRMIDRITAHYGVATVSIVAHSKGGMDTERALYGNNPYNTSIPSFGYEKVDAVYTLSSPLKGSRVADVGAALSWTGVAFIAMWYANGYQLTSGSVNSFHNWAKSWRINSTTTFRNAYHPNGASYSRINMIEDNTTRWWAHQSNDPCYQNIWYYCYVGDAFHHSAGAYYDAYWEWDWFDSGWRNWHTENDGFIAEYRAKRSVITDAGNALTPGAGDYNWRTMRDANHTSLWSYGENHFTNEIAPYLHYGLYNTSGRNNTSGNELLANKIQNPQMAPAKLMMRSQGNTYFSKTGQTDFIVEEDNQAINMIFYTASAFKHFEIINSQGKIYQFNIINSQKDDLTAAYEAVARITNLPKGVYTLQLPVSDFVAMADYEDTTTAFAVNMNFDESEGYNGETIELSIANANKNIDFSKVSVFAELSKVSDDGYHTLPVKSIHKTTKTLQTVPGKSGYYQTRFGNLTPGAVYGVRISATSTEGQNLLARNILQTFYVKKDLPLQDINVVESAMDVQSLSGDMVSIYPNPAVDHLQISLDKSIPASIDIYNTTGMLMSTYQTQGKNLNINVKDWNKGVYFVNITTQKGSVSKKILIK